ncbi:MAG: hypothetical protein QGG34_06475 [SAR202 cluster bacterium]|nr:hypothetical protein [SAR202 cluster bacterium]MDP6301020.1 hypothetical protein [SAR202 cluster bacterium]MDP7103660.1 hypothetical protein [SAR202 cluster bacterium]
MLGNQHPGDHADAATMLAESLAIANEFGMGPFAERVQALREGLGA